MTHFTPYSAVIGGALIGAAAALLLYLNGRIAGISGILGGLLPPTWGDTLWRVLFLAGLVGGAALCYAGFGHAPRPRPDFPGALLVIAGLLIGYGTHRAGGCTSGHGICGIARLSRRSIVATLVFFTTGVLAAYFTRHVFGVY